MELCRQRAARSQTDCQNPKKNLMRGLRSGRRSAGPDVLDDLPRAVYLASVDYYVAAFGIDFGAGGDVGEGFLEVAAIVGQVAGSLEILAVQREVAVEAGHDRLAERTQRGRAGDALAVGLQESGVRSIKLQNRIELFRAQILHPSFTQFGERFQSCGLRRGCSGRAAGKSRRGDQSDNRERNDGAPRAGN